MFSQVEIEIKPEELEVMKRLETFELDEYGANGLDPNSNQMQVDD
jgi:hypothetical protein